MQLGVDADGALLQRALDGQSVDDGDIAALVTIARRLEALDQRGLRTAPRLRRRAATALGRPARRLGRHVRGPRTRGRTLRQAGPSTRRRGGDAARGARAGSVRSRSRRCRATASIPSAADRRGRPRAAPGPGGSRPRPPRPGARARGRGGAAGRTLGRRTRGRDRHGWRAGLAADRAAEDAVDLARALDAATESSVTAHGVLREAYRSAQRGDALTSLSDFYAEVVPSIDALETAPLPPVAAAAWQRLHDVLARGRDETLRELVACSTCGEASAAARALLAHPSAGPCDG